MVAFVVRTEFETHGLVGTPSANTEVFVLYISDSCQKAYILDHPQDFFVLGNFKGACMDLGST